MPKIIFVNRFFFPDHSATGQLLSDLVFSLAEQDRNVCVITSRMKYSDPHAKLPPSETLSGIRVIRVKSTRFGRTNLLGRSLDYASFYLSAAWAVFRIGRRGDVVVANTDPPLLALALWPAVRAKRMRLVNWLQDIFPEIAVAMNVGGSPGKWIGRILTRLRKVTLKNAHMNVVLGSSMARHLEGQGVSSSRIKIIPNWADAALTSNQGPAPEHLRREWGLRSFTVGYSGNFGRAHDVQTILDGIRHANPTDISWLFVGGGIGMDRVRTEVASANRQNVVFKPYQPRDQLGSSLRIPDVHLVSLHSVLEGYVFPSKIFGILAVGRPTIFIGDSRGEIATLIESNSCGIAVQQGDAAGLADAIQTLLRDAALREAMGKNAQSLFMESFAKHHSLSKWTTLLHA